MCLIIDKKLTENKLKSSQKTFYKAVEILKKSDGYNANCLRTPYRYYIMDRPGTQTIPKKERLKKYDDYVTNGAFHLFTKKVKSMWVVIPVTVTKEDIIIYGSFGNKECVAVYAYTISEKTWNKIFKEK